MIIKSINDEIKYLDNGTNYNANGKYEDNREAIILLAMQLRREADYTGITWGQDWEPLLNKFDTSNAIAFLEGRRNAITY